MSLCALRTISPGVMIGFAFYGGSTLRWPTRFSFPSPVPIRVTSSLRSVDRTWECDGRVTPVIMSCYVKRPRSRLEKDSLAGIGEGHAAST